MSKSDRLDLQKGRKGFEMTGYFEKIGGCQEWSVGRRRRGAVS